MKPLQDYIFQQVDEANAQLPADAEEKLEQLFKKMAPELKAIEKAADDKFKHNWEPHVNGARVGRTWVCEPDEAHRESLSAVISDLKTHSGKWTYAGPRSESIGRGGYEYFDVFTMYDGEVKYQLHAIQHNDPDKYWSVRLGISYPIIMDAAELDFTPNTSDKSKDVTGKPIKVGDAVAYCSRAVSGNSPMPVGVVTEVTPKQITVYDKINNNLVKLPGFKCCVIVK